jgi:hypothetical protein
MTDNSDRAASRRSFLKATLASSVGVALSSPGQAASPSEQTPPASATPLIHMTDLFHPHGDPDDHFDLACAYALAARGTFDLRGVVIDYPPDFRPGDPAVAAVAQLNWLTGLAVPIAIGTSRRLAHRRDPLADAPKQETAAVDFILRQLRAADHPVALVCVGSAADVVVAAVREPAVFKSKCAGIYLNSGAAHDNPANPSQLEFNVRLDPAAYAAMFDLPCPLYWFPCWHTTEVRQSGASGSFYWLPHREVLADASPGLANYFAHMFEKSTNPKWLRAMKSPPPAESWRKILEGQRGMWSTASQFAAAGLTVTRDGRIVSAREAGDAAIFKLQAIEVACADDGRTTWRVADKETGRWMLAVTDVARYPDAMLRAVQQLLRELGDE